MIIVVSGDLLQTYIGWELVGATCMALASFWYRDQENARIGLKTGLLLRVGDFALLTAILSIYALQELLTSQNFKRIQNGFSHYLNRACWYPRCSCF